MSKTRRPPLPLLLTVLGLAGCANQDVTRSGFLTTGYADLVPDSEQPKVLVAGPNAALLARYDAVLIEPVQVRIASADALIESERALTAEDREALAEVAVAAQERLRDALAQEWAIASVPGARTIRVRTALTAVRKANPVVNIVLAAVIVPLDNGGLSAETEFTDSRAGKRLGAVAWADQGALNPIGYFTAYGHAKALTEDLARTLARTLRRSAPQG